MKAIFARKTFSPASWLIRAITFSRWSHCAIILSDGNVIDTTLITGVRILSYEKFIKHYPTYEVVEIDVKNEETAVDFALDQVGKPYDWTALFGLVMQRKWQEDDSWFCSELVEAIILAGDTQRFRDRVSRITPQMSWAVL